MSQGDVPDVGHENDWSKIATDDLRMLSETLATAWDGRSMPHDWDLKRENRLLREIDAEINAR